MFFTCLVALRVLFVTGDCFGKSFSDSERVAVELSGSWLVEGTWLTIFWVRIVGGFAWFLKFASKGSVPPEGTRLCLRLFCKFMLFSFSRVSLVG